MSQPQRKQPIPPQRQQQPGKEDIMVPQPEYIRQNYKGSGKLLDQVAVITGGDSGIGRAVAVHFAREGADIAIIYLNEHSDAEKTKELVESEGRRCILFSGDVSNPVICNQAVERAVNHLGKIDILVNNAAEQHVKQDIEEISPEQLERTFRTNLFAYFFMAQAALKHMKKGATIVNTTSVTAYEGSSHLLDYSSSKGAIVSFTRSLSQSLLEKEIRVNAVAPGPIWTPLIPATFGEKEVEKFGQNYPMKRPGQPSEVAPSFVFLACEDASYMTGQVLHPNGGEVVGS